jgi:uncharacterized protein
MKTYLTPELIRYQLSNLSQLTFEVTDACNLRCKYCGYGEFYEDYDLRENKYLPVTKAKQIIDYLVQFWQSQQNRSARRHVYISFYGGEPLLNMPFIQEIVKYVEDLHLKNRHFSFSMTTNGILLHKYLEYLENKDFNILVSLDGNKENNAYRVDAKGNHAFEKIIENVDLSQKNYPDYFKRKVNFNAVLHDKNSVESIYHFFKTRYDKIPSVGELNNMGIRADKVKLFNETYRNQQESLQQAKNYEEIEQESFIQSPTYQSVCTFLHKYSGFVYRDYNELLYGISEENNWISGTCVPFGKKMFITVNGKILPCERIGHQYAIGQVTDTNIELDFNYISEKYNHYFAKLEKQCAKCFGQRTCIQCIFNIDNLEGCPTCHGLTDKNEFEQYVYENMNFIYKHPEDYFRLMEEVIIE